MDDGKVLQEGSDSLAFGVPRSVPGVVYALGLAGGYSVGPREGRTVYFGRNRPEVHVCIGEDDRQISRRHGVLTHREGQWWVSNTGRRPIRLPRSQWLFANEAAIALGAGYTPLFVAGSGDREHLLEVYVTGPDPAAAPRTYPLSADERLILVV